MLTGHSLGAGTVSILYLSIISCVSIYLVVTGHSLGAGTASILSFILREKYKDRVVKCFAYSPPGTFFYKQSFSRYRVGPSEKLIVIFVRIK